MSQESRPDVTGILPGCHRISARIRREGWPDGAGILIKNGAFSQIIRLIYRKNHSKEKKNKRTCKKRLIKVS